MNQREASQKNWKSGNTIEDINSGSLQRIADATEMMANNYASLITARNTFESLWKREVANRKKLEYQIRGLKGAITKLKKAKP